VGAFPEIFYTVPTIQMLVCRDLGPVLFEKSLLLRILAQSHSLHALVYRSVPQGVFFIAALSKFFRYIRIPAGFQDLTPTQPVIASKVEYQWIAFRDRIGPCLCLRIVRVRTSISILLKEAGRLPTIP
jgi:hypothetical protein